MFVLDRSLFEDADDIFEATDKKCLETIIQQSYEISKNNTLNNIRLLIWSKMRYINTVIHEIEEYICDIDDYIYDENVDEVDKEIVSEANDDIRYQNFLCACEIFELCILIYICSKQFDQLDIYKNKIYNDLFVKFRELVKHLNHLSKRSWNHVLHDEAKTYPYMELYTLKLTSIRHYGNFHQLFLINLY